MLSQSLLDALWREVAAPPFSSASSQAEITPGSSPVSVASRDANACWPVVICDAAAVGSEVAPTPAPPLAPGVPIADASAEVNVDEVPLVGVAVAALAVAGENAVWSAV